LIDEETNALEEVETEKQVTQIVGYDSEGYKRTTFNYTSGDRSGTCLVEEDNESYTVYVNNEIGPAQSDPRYFNAEKHLEVQSTDMQEAAVRAVAQYLNQNNEKTVVRAGSL
jgi:hypothetical protein